MKYIILSILLLGQFSPAVEKAAHEKLLEKHIGNWESSVEGKISINGNAVNQLVLSGLRKTRSLFGGKLISSTYTLKGNNFEGGKTDLEGLSFLFWDENKQALRTLDFSSDGMAYTALFKVLDDNSYKTVFKEEPDVENKSGVSFAKEGKEMHSFMFNKNVKYGTVSEMKWLQKKSEDKSFKLDLQETEKINEKYIRYKTDAYKWILKGQFLYSEGKDETGRFVAVIGSVSGQTGKKFKIFEDGSVKAYRPRNAHVWDEVKIKDE